MNDFEPLLFDKHSVKKKIHPKQTNSQNAIQNNLLYVEKKKPIQILKNLVENL